MSTPPPEPPIRRVDRILAFTALGLIAASIVGFVAIIVGTANGMNEKAFAEGAWPFVASILYWGPPLAFALIITLLIMSFVRKGRAASRDTPTKQTGSVIEHEEIVVRYRRKRRLN